MSYKKALILEFEQEREKEYQQQEQFQEFVCYGDLMMMENVNASASFKRIGSIPKPIVFPPPPAHQLNPLTAQFLFKKELKLSDVGKARRVVIPKGDAERFLPRLTAKEGIFLYMDDMESFQVWVFRFRYWHNDKSRMFVLEKTGDFVKAHGLGAGDSILIFKDEQADRYGIQAKKQMITKNGANMCTSYNANFVETDEIGTYVYPGNDKHNFMMDFLGVPEPTAPNVEQSVTFEPSDIYPYYYD